MRTRKHDGANEKANGKMSGGRSSTVKRADFEKDPGRYVDQAKEQGPVTITDARGKPRVMLVLAKPAEPYPTE